MRGTRHNTVGGVWSTQQRPREGLTYGLLGDNVAGGGGLHGLLLLGSFDGRHDECVDVRKLKSL
jgi:hypothetical protein